MAYYLSFDGVDDYLQAPSATVDSIEIDLAVDATQVREHYYFDARNGGLAFYAFGVPDSSDIFKGSGTGTITWNGSAVTTITKGARGIFKALGTSPTTDVIEFFIFNGLTNYRMKAKVYRITGYNGATVVFNYDMTLGNQVAGTVQDQSGNGRHATLSGGPTWVSDAGTGTAGSISYATKQSIYQTTSVALATKQVINRSGATAYATKQAIYQTASVSYATQQTITNNGIPGAISYRTKQIIYQVSSAQMATKQAIYRIGSSQWATQQSIMDFVEIISVIDIAGEYDFVIDMVGEMDNALDIQGEMEATTIDIKGVIGMAILNADITIYRENDKDIRDTVKTKDGTPTNLAGSSVQWSMKKRPLDGVALFEKQTPSGVTITDPANGVFVVHLSDSDTNIQFGRYYYAAKVTDALGKTTTVSEGYIVIKP